jgi:hypothetical protein
MKANAENRLPFIAVNLTPAMSGYFATLYTWSFMEGGVDIHGKPYAGSWFPEPWTSGIGRYPTWEQANAEGASWAKIEGCEFVPATAERVAEAAASSERFSKRMARIRQLTEGGMDRKEAWAQAKAEFQ